MSTHGAPDYKDVINSTTRADQRNGHDDKPPKATHQIHDESDEILGTNEQVELEDEPPDEAQANGVAGLGDDLAKAQKQTNDGQAETQQSSGGTDDGPSDWDADPLDSSTPDDDLASGAGNAGDGGRGVGLGGLGAAGGSTSGGGGQGDSNPSASNPSSSGSGSHADNISALAERLRKNLARGIGETTEFVNAEVRSHTDLQRLALAVFNKRFALFKPGASDIVIDKSKPGLDLIKVPDFARRYSPITAKYNDDRVPLAKFWLSLAGAHRVERIVLRPNEGRLKDPNLWNMAGSFITPIKSTDPPYFFRLVRDAFRPDDGDWLLDFVADMVQYPQVKPHTAPAVTGKSGCGKTHLWRYVGAMLGEQLYYEMSGFAGISNKFNADTEAALLIFIDEAQAMDLRGALPLFKTLVTGSTRRIERKGVDPFVTPNISRLVLAGEHKPVLLSDGGMRRRVPLFEMLPTFLRDRQFWDGYRNEMKLDGPARLLAHLRDRKITHRLHEAPVTEIGRKTAREHLDPLYQWLVGICESFTRWHDMAARQVAIADLMLDLREWWKANRRHGEQIPNQERVIAVLRLAGATFDRRERKTVDGVRVRTGIWTLPKAADMADALAKELGIDIEPDDEW
jgi:hypothetical protein